MTTKLKYSVLALTIMTFLIAPTYVMAVGLSKEYIEYQKKCWAAKATWALLPTTCEDLCRDEDDETICKYDFTWGCDCGPNKCWNGSTCQVEEGATMPKPPDYGKPKR